MKAFGLDKEAGLDLDVDRARLDRGRQDRHSGRRRRHHRLGLAVGRARARATARSSPSTPIPPAIGAVMTKDAAIKSVEDLAGKKLGVAGGPLDKSWLMLKAYALQAGRRSRKDRDRRLWRAAAASRKRRCRASSTPRWSSGTSPPISKAGASRRAIEICATSRRRSAPRARRSSPAMCSTKASPRRTGTRSRASSP